MEYLLNDNGEKLTLIHGTNRKFTTHDPKKNRTILNDNYQGDWICYSANENVGWKYADAARNQCFDKEDFLEETKKVFSSIDEDAVNFMIELSTTMMENGWEDGWDKAIESFREKNNIDKENASYEFFQKVRTYEQALDFDINDFCDCLEKVEYSKMATPDALNDIVSLFGGGNKIEISCYDIEMLEKMGYSKIIPEPRLLESHVKANNILKTDSREEAKAARQNGYDLVIYSGPDCVDNEPEYLIANPEQIEVKAIHKKVVEQKLMDEDDFYETTYYKIVREEINPSNDLTKKSKRRMKM